MEHHNTTHGTDGEQSQTDDRSTLTEDTGVGEGSQNARLLKANKQQYFNKLSRGKEEQIRRWHGK